MALKVCADCGAEISTQAVSCPHCGRDRRVETYEEERRRKGFNNALVLLLVIAALALYAGLGH
jgi:ribosomal protein L40E